MSAAYNKFFINGKWIEPAGRSTLDVINPATEKAFATISLGNADDVDSAAKAGKSAFDSWSNSSIEERNEIISVDKTSINEEDRLNITDKTETEEDPRRKRRRSSASSEK